MLTEHDLRKADILSAGVLAALGIAVAASALGMPMSGRHAGEDLTWYTSPGLLPLITGILLFGFSIGVLLRAVRKRGHHGLIPAVVQALKSLPRNSGARTAFAVWGLLGGYIALLALHPFAGLARLFERIVVFHYPFADFLLDPEGANYLFSSAIFLAGFMLMAYLPGPKETRARRIALIATLSLAIPWTVGYVFTAHLATRLPW